MQLTHQQAVNREKDIQDELERLKAKKDKTAEDHAKVPQLLEEFRQVHAYRLDLEHDAALAEVRGALDEGVTPAPAADGGEDRGERQTGVVDRKRVDYMSGKFKNPWDLSTMRFDSANPGGELRSRALDAVERMPFVDNDKVREAAAKLIERDDTDGGSPLSKLALYTSSPEYCQVFTKLVRSRGQVGALLPDEVFAYQRAMSLTDSAGGFMVPFQLDPSIILTASGSLNQVRQIARVVTATGDAWHGVTSAGVTGSWDAEASEVSDDSPTVAQPEIPVHSANIFVAASFEVQQDAANLAAEIANLISFEKDRMESVAHVTGSGSGQPTGIITALTASSNPAVVVDSATAYTFAAGDVYELDASLPARWAMNGSWLAHRAIYNKIRQFDQSGGSNLWGYLADGRKTDLLGRPNYVAEAMDGTITTGQDNHVLVFGDFTNYVVVDRIGTTLSYIPHLFGESGRPTGQSGWYTKFRSGGDSVNDAAFRLLNVGAGGS